MLTHREALRVLGLTSDATAEEVRLAYKKLALKLHPDKCGGKSDDFIKLQEAYQILQGDNFESNENIFSELMRELFRNVFKPTQAAAQSKDLCLNIDVTLEELYMPAIKKVIVKVKRNGEFISLPLYVSLLNYETEYVFSKMGDDECCDVIVNINIMEHSNIHIDQIICKYDLYIEYDITLYEYYFTDSFRIPWINGSYLEVSKPQSKELIHVEKGKGLPYVGEGEEVLRGNLFIYFKVRYPKSLPAEAEAFAQKYFGHEQRCL
jgi:DnaJ-class molecular chaperone